MKQNRQNLIRESLETFVKGHAFTKSLTHPYEAVAFGDYWCLRDSTRRNAKDYRKEEWIGYQVDPDELIGLAKSQTRGRHFLCVLVDDPETVQSTRDEFKSRGYRLIITEYFFVHHLKRIPQNQAIAEFVRMDCPELARQYAKAARMKPLPERFLANDSPWRHYLALVNEQIAGWVSSLATEQGTWCSNLVVREKYRRRGIGSGLMCRLLRDDRRYRSAKSVLLSTHTGALLYPQLGYETLGTLLIMAPKTRK